MDWFLILLEPLSVIPASTRMVMSQSMFNNASSLLCCLAVFNLCILDSVLKMDFLVALTHDDFFVSNLQNIFQFYSAKSVESMNPITY